MKVRILIALMTALVTLPSFAQNEDVQLRREIQGYYARFDKLVGAGDVKGVLSLIDPSFVAVDRNGNQMTFAQMKSMMTDMAKTMKNLKSKISVKHVRRQSDEAVAWIEMTMSYLAKSGERWKAMKSTMRFAETLKKTGAGWKCVYSQELPTDEPWGFKMGR